MPSLIFAVSLFFIPVLKAPSHPHMAIYTCCELHFDEGRPQGVWVEFRFDRFFSADILYGYDQNQDQRFDSVETQDVYDYAFSNMKNYGYFLYIRQGENRKAPSSVESFSVRAEEGFVIYRFYVNLHGLISRPEQRSFSVSVFDTTYFCACSYEQEPVKEGPGVPNSLSYRIEENRDFPVYYDPCSPVWDTTVHETWKPWLVTAYPEELSFGY